MLWAVTISDLIGMATITVMCDWVYKYLGEFARVQK